MKPLRTALFVAATIAAMAMAVARPVPAASPGTSQRVQTSSVRKRVANIKELNYYPARAGWILMWTDFNPKVIGRDFGRIRALGANTVRIIVQPDAFGFPTVRPRMARRLSKVVRLAKQHSLGVHLTLFDLWSGYSSVRASKKWAKSLLSPYRHDHRITVVELKNEINPENPAAVTWVTKLLPYVKKLMPGTLETVSTPNVPPKDFESFTHALRHSPPDFWDYHYYGPAFGAYWSLHKIRALAGKQPLFIGETGYSTVGSGKSHKTLDHLQAHYYLLVFRAARQLGLASPAPWIFSDFAPGGIPPGRLAQEPQAYKFGLYRVNGTRKKAASVVSSFFKGKR